MRRRWPVLLSIVLGATGLALGGLALGQSGPPDTDYELAEEQYGANGPCPQGETFQVAQWEELQKIADEQEAISSVNFSGTVPAIDVVWVAPADPSPFIDKVPATGTVIVACAPVGPDELVLVDGDALVVGGE